jgi:hypothetical protein
MRELDVLLLNAKLRDELEPYLDESFFVVDLKNLPTPQENEYLASMLDWERAPVLPISQWFDPELTLLPHESLSDAELHQQLHQVIGRLFEKNIVLEFTDHLSDRQLYCLIARDILPVQEKRVNLRQSNLAWQCIDEVEDEESWLRFYATAEERNRWASQTGLKLPPRQRLPFPRKLPRASDR